MKSAPIPDNEIDRLKALFDCNILDSEPEEEFDALTELAAEICGTPIALVSLIDETRQWFKSHHGLDATETPRELAFCAHAIHQSDIFEVEDSRKDERFHDNPLVTDAPNVVFYAGSPLVSPDGYKLGTLCVIDHHPHSLNESQKKQLNIIAKQVVQLLELRKSNLAKEIAFDGLLKLSKNIDLHNSELKEFSTRVAHDIKGPVRQIQNIAQFCIEDLESGNSSEVRNHCEMILSRCANLQDFIASVFELTCANLIADKASLINFDTLLNTAIQSSEDLASQKGVTVESEISVTQEWKLEEIRVQQVLTNLISNAIKYSDPQKADRIVRIAISDSADSEQLILTVEDNGLGIPKEAQNKVFERFERFHPQHGEGTGLGMTIVQKHVNALGGDVSFTSSPNGTLFKVVLHKHNEAGQ